MTPWGTTARRADATVRTREGFPEFNLRGAGSTGQSRSHDRKVCNALTVIAPRHSISAAVVGASQALPDRVASRGGLRTLTNCQE